MNTTRQSWTALTLSTVAFAISFAVWGMLAPMAKSFQPAFHITKQQAWMMVAAPVLLGSLMRIPMGMLTDRYGGRIVFAVLMLMSAIPAFMLSRAQTYAELMIWAFPLGLAGASFAVGVPFTSRWYPKEKQGLALGIFGAGNIGQSVAVFGVPVLARLIGGWRTTFEIFAAIIFVYGVFFYLAARNAPVKVVPKSFGEMMRVLRRERLSWVLSLFYFVTFGGFVALGLGLTMVLQDIFRLPVENAALRVAGFIVLATAMRPVGGALSDRFGGARVLSVVFAAAAVLALGMAFEAMPPFTVGALGVALFIGLGNGAVFKLVPEYFPNDTGTVTGLVGAIGGLGGFFPPILLGYIWNNTGHHYSLGFVLLSLFCATCFLVNRLVFLGKGNPSPDESKPAMVGLSATVIPTLFMFGA